MVHRSVIFKLLVLVSLAFALTTASILLVARDRVNRMLDASQEEIYADKIGVIVGILERTNKRLESTGLVEAYSADFKQSAINLLKDTYYKDPEQEVYPTILDEQGRVVLDLKLHRHVFYQPQFVPPLQSKTGTTEEKCQTFTAGDNWFIYDTFTPWRWFVVYSIPHEVKYREAHRLLGTLTVIMLVISFAVLLLLSFTLTRLLRPISELTKHAREIAGGNLERPVIQASSDEFGTLADSFEVMRQAVISKISALADKEEKLQVTLDSIGDCVIATDTEGNITKINAAACRLTGWQQDEALGSTIERIMTYKVHEDGEVTENPVRTVLRTFAPASLPQEVTLIAKDKTEYLISDSAAPIRSIQDGFIGVVTVFRDITRERVLQDQLQHSQRMDAIGQLAGGVAHDFNNMLTGIGGAVELLEMIIAGNDKGLKYVELIKTATDRASGLTRKLLDFSRKGKQASTPVNLHTIIEDAVAILERSIDMKITITTELRASRVAVIGDPSQLQSGILNICVNARDAMPDGGEIHISTRNVDREEEFYNIDSQLLPETFIQLSIKDTGTGILPEIQPHIFEPFYTTKKVGKGTGLGLAAVYGMVKEHHGSIRLESEPGKGTVFHIYLPTTHETGSGTAKKSERMVHGSGTILVIDDEIIIRTTTSLLLENLGYTVLLAENGEAGANLYQREVKNIDLVILDMVMPVMGGREAFDKIIAINPEAKVIISSGYARNVDLTYLTQRKPAGFITKPFNQFEMSELIAQVLAK